MALVKTASSNYTAAQTNTTLITPTSGRRLRLTAWEAMVSKECVLPQEVLIIIGSTTVRGHPGIPPGGGGAGGQGVGILAEGAIDEVIKVTCDDPTGGGATSGAIRVSVTAIEVD